MCIFLPVCLGMVFTYPSQGKIPPHTLGERLFILAVGGFVMLCFPKRMYGVDINILSMFWNESPGMTGISCWLA